MLPLDKKQQEVTGQILVGVGPVRMFEQMQCICQYIGGKRGLNAINNLYLIFTQNELF